MATRTGNHAAIALALGAITMGAAALFAPGCGTDAVGVEACRTIETARCKNAPNCPSDGFDLSQPPHRGSPGTDVDACISYYRDQCLHGLASGTDPGNVAVNACVARINDSAAADYCDVVKTPQNFAECSFLVATDSGAADTSTADAFGGCPTGCTDFGVEFCNGSHFCVCPGALATTPSNCTASSTNVTGGGAPYCCQ